MKREAVGKNTIPGLPFSPGIRSGDFLFISGQGPIGADGKIVQGDARTQTKITMDNFQKIVQDAGMKMSDVVQTTVYLTDLSDYQAMNAVYASYFSDPKPARATVRADLLFGMKVEVQGVAIARHGH